MVADVLLSQLRIAALRSVPRCILPNPHRFHALTCTASKKERSCAQGWRHAKTPQVPTEACTPEIAPTRGPEAAVGCPRQLALPEPRFPSRKLRQRDKLADVIRRLGRIPANPEHCHTRGGSVAQCWLTGCSFSRQCPDSAAQRSHKGWWNLERSMLRHAAGRHDVPFCG